jgi:hypothetical protein
LSVVDPSAFEAALERRGFDAEVWSEVPDDQETIEPHDDVRVTIWNGTRIVYDDYERADRLSETLDFLVVLMDGGALA